MAISPIRRRAAGVTGSMIKALQKAVYTAMPNAATPQLTR